MLNPQQKKAVETTKGRLLILAGAGSGKTSVIVQRIAYIIETLHASPDSILGLTFTNKAAAEMRSRVAQKIGEATSKKVTLSTFHSFCLKILRREIKRLGYTSDFSIYDERDVRRVALQLSRDMLGQEGEMPPIDALLQEISKAKSQGIVGKGFSGDLFHRLQTAMRAYNAVDFDNLLSLTVELFENHPDVLERYQFAYVMIDEYQDTNPIQDKLGSLLSKKHNNLCVVGDDDQAIYSWRGANVKNILSFDADTTIRLEQNYRSTPTILKGANAVIRNNTERHSKELWSTKDPGEPIEIFTAPTETEEAEAVIYRALHYHQKFNIPWHEMAILYRSNLLSRNFEIALMKANWEKEGEWVRGIPYRIYGGLEMSERSEIKDMAAYLRTILNPKDEEAILRIINVPRRGISDQALDKITQHNRTTKKPLWDVLQSDLSPLELSDRATSGVKEFVSIINEARSKFKTSPYSTDLKWLLDRTGYQKAIHDEVKSEKARSYKWENVETFVQTLETFDGTLHEFLETMMLDHFTTHDKHKKDDHLSLMTFHGAKGLEFTVCFLIGLEDHLIPHERSILENSLEEERRLMYVAMTRAKKHLTLSMAKRRKRFGKDSPSSPSRFLFEIPKEILKVSPWDQI